MVRHWVCIKIVFCFPVLLLGGNFNVHALRVWNLHLFFQHFPFSRQSALNNKIKTDIVINQIRFVCSVLSLASIRCFHFFPGAFSPCHPFPLHIRISFTLLLSLLSPIICCSFCAVSSTAKQAAAEGTRHTIDLDSWAFFPLLSSSSSSRWSSTMWKTQKHVLVRISRPASNTFRLWTGKQRIVVLGRLHVQCSIYHIQADDSHFSGKVASSCGGGTCAVAHKCARVVRSLPDPERNRENWLRTHSTYARSAMSARPQCGRKYSLLVVFIGKMPKWLRFSTQTHTCAVCMDRFNLFRAYFPCRWFSAYLIFDMCSPFAVRNANGRRLCESTHTHTHFTLQREN